MCLMHPLQSNLKLRLTFAVMAGVALCAFVVGEACSAEVLSEVYHARKVPHRSSHVTKDGQKLPGNESRPYPEAFPPGDSSEFEFDCKDWRPLVSSGSSGDEPESRYLRDRCLGKPLPSYRPDLSLRILFCTWLI